MEGRRLLAEIRGRPIELVPGKRAIGVSPGEWTSPFEGRGYEPRGFRDFAIGDNPRQIHLPTSARRNMPTIVERVALRDVKILIVVDLAASMHARSKMVIQHEAAAMLLFAAWQGETTFGLAVRMPDGIRAHGFGIGSKHFYRLYEVLWNLCTHDVDVRHKGTPIHLGKCLPPNAMLIYCSDFLDSDGGIRGVGKLLGAVSRYDFIPVIVQDELEYGFPTCPQTALVAFANPATGVRESIWLSPNTSADIRALHEARFDELTHLFKRRNASPMHLALPGVNRIYVTIDGYFRQRRRLAA